MPSRALVGLLVLAGCDETPGRQTYQNAPIRVSVQLQRGDSLYCKESAYRVGFPTDNGWISIFVIGNRELHCTIAPAVPTPTTWAKTRVVQE